MTNVTKLPTAMDRAEALKAKALNFIEQAQGALGEAEEALNADERQHDLPSPSAQHAMIHLVEVDNVLEEAAKMLGGGVKVVSCSNIRQVSPTHREIKLVSRGISRRMARPDVIDQDEPFKHPGLFSDFNLRVRLHTQGNRVLCENHVSRSQ